MQTGSLHKQMKTNSKESKEGDRAPGPQLVRVGSRPLEARSWPAAELPAPTHFLSYSQDFLGSAGTQRQGEMRREERKENT